MSVNNYPFKYIPSKPVTFADLAGYRWCYIEAPPDKVKNMGGCPVSKHEFGVIATDKFVLESARKKAGLTPV